MSQEVLIKVEGVSKKFCRRLKRSLMYGVQDIGTELLGRAKKPELRKHEFWAVDDVSFELKRGECLGLIGHNGAGKSTLLKMLNGLIKPDKGRIAMKGRIGALIELGTGFNPILTGRENVYNNGAVLGFSKNEIDKKFDSIVDFAEIGDFIDTPVQNYSSGMKVRLGFAVASRMEPDVLLVDEVLAVGDLGFKLKCFNAMDQMMENTAIIFVSHSMPMISRMCTDVNLMDKGLVKYHGEDVAYGIDLYYNSFAYQDSVIFSSDNSIAFISSEVISNEKINDVAVIAWMEDLMISTKIELRKEYKTLSIGYVILDKEQRNIGAFSTGTISLANLLTNHDNTLIINSVLPKTQIAKGIYTIDMVISEEKRYKPLLRIKGVCNFHIKDEVDIWTPMRFKADWQINGHAINILTPNPEQKTTNKKQ